MENGLEPSIHNPDKSEGSNQNRKAGKNYSSLCIYKHPQNKVLLLWHSFRSTLAKLLHFTPGSHHLLRAPIQYCYWLNPNNDWIATDHPTSKESHYKENKIKTSKWKLALVKRKIQGTEESLGKCVIILEEIWKVWHPK